MATGIRYRPPIPGMVSEYEERHAAKWGGYRWHDWRALEREDRVHGVAHYRLDRLVENHSNDAVSQAGKDRAVAGRSRSKPKAR